MNNNLQHEIDKRGIVLSSSEREKLLELQQTAIEAARKLHQDKTTELTKLDYALQQLPALQAVLHQTSDVIQVFVQSLLTSFGLMVILVGVLWVEGVRVYEGISLFDPNVAVGGAVVLVMMNTVLEFIIHWVEHQNNWINPPRYQFSFALVARRLSYIIGKEKNFTPLAKSPAHEFKVYMRLLTAGILFIALVGSMKEAISGVNGNWFDGFISIFTQSTLAEFTTWLSGFIFALITVVGAQRLTAYVAKRVTETLAHAETLGTSNTLDYEIQQAIENVTHEVYMKKIIQHDEKQAKKQEKEQETEPVNPIQPLPVYQNNHYHNGNGNGNGNGV